MELQRKSRGNGWLPPYMKDSDPRDLVMGTKLKWQQLEKLKLFFPRLAKDEPRSQYPVLKC